MASLRLCAWAAVMLLGLPTASAAKAPSPTSSTAAKPSATKATKTCATELVRDGTFEDLTNISQSHWTVTSDDDAACDIVNDGFDSSGHAFWVYNPRISDAASCTLSQTISKPKDATAGKFEAHILPRSGNSSIKCTLVGANHTIVLANLQNTPATGKWTGLNKTIEFGKQESYMLNCKLTCPPDGSLRVDDISLVANKGGKCGIPVKLKPAVKNYKYSGCLTESSRHRILPGDELATGNMTLETCADFCKAWPFFGVEYSRECFCGENVARDAKTVSLKQCNAPCSGNSSQICGGWNRVSVYHDKSIVGPIDPPKIISGGGSSGWVGCYTEAGATGGASRTLVGASYASNNMTLKSCEAFCISEGMKTAQKTPFKYWGTEYGRECYCGDTLSKGATKVDKRECQQACSGNKKDVCGGALLVSVYQYTGAKSVNSTKHT